MANRIPLDSLCQPKVATLPNDFDDVIDYIDISSVDNESKTIIAHQEVDAKDAPSRARQLLQVGDVIVSTVRPNLNAVALVESAYENTLVGSTGYCVLRVKDGVDNRFVFYFCQSPYFVEDMTAQATGASYPAVTASIVRNSTLPAYSLEEQHEIAQHLDTVTNLISLRKQQIAKLDELVKARFVEMFGDPRSNPLNLPMLSLSELGEWNSGGTPARSNADYFTGDIDWYSAGELNTLYLNGSIERITEEAIQNSAAKLFPAGSMLVGMYDTAAFKMGILRTASASNQACACIEPNDSINIVWLYYCLHLMKDYFLEQRRGVRQKNLNLGMIRSFQIPCAPKIHQDRFAAFVAQTDQQKLTIQHSLAQLELLKKALMQKYFG